VPLTEYFLNSPEQYLHLDKEDQFIKSCSTGPVSLLPQTKQLISKFEEIKKQEIQLFEKCEFKKDNLLQTLSFFNDLRVDSAKISSYRKTLMSIILIEYNLKESLKSKYKLVRNRLNSNFSEDRLDWKKITRHLKDKLNSFKSISEEMNYYQSKLKMIEDEELKETFLEFVKKYLEYLDKIHVNVNKLTTFEEADQLEKEILETFGDCPIMSKKAKELKEIAKNKSSLLCIVEKIKKCYRIFDKNKESLQKLKLEDDIDIQKIELYENEFTKIYNEGMQIEQTEKLSSLAQMKKSIDSYLALRKKEKDFDMIRRFLRGEVESSIDDNEMLGKRSSPEKEKEEENRENLKKVKTGESSELGTNGNSKELSEEESLKIEEESLASLENSELSDVDSTCSNEYILKQRQKIKKLKSLVIKKKEEQNDLVNQSDEKTSSFLHKKFSLMLLFYKLRVLGLDLETCSKTDIYLNTVKETDEMMKKTSLGKVTVSELKRLVIKCEEMKYFSQGYQKFKRLQNLFKSFKSLTEEMRSQFRGGLKITQEIKQNFLERADLSSYKTSLTESSNGQFSIVLTRKKHSLFTKNSKKDWGNLNNKRKTKLRLGSESSYSHPRNSKKKVKEKLINAIYNQYENNYCLCRESYELTSMIQFNECEEWFHKECIKIPKYQMKRIKTKMCPACFFLHQIKCDKFLYFDKRKIPFERFLTILKTAKVLSNFILDERIDEIFYIQAKLKKLEQNFYKVANKIQANIQNGKELKSMWSHVHNVAALYIYLPVKIESVELKLHHLSKLVLEKKDNGNSLDHKMKKEILKKEILDKAKVNIETTSKSNIVAMPIVIEEVKESNGLQIEEEKTDTDKPLNPLKIEKQEQTISSKIIIESDKKEIKIEKELPKDEKVLEVVNEKCSNGNGNHLINNDNPQVEILEKHEDKSNYTDLIDIKTKQTLKH
jgi:acyl-CoA synthetase (AMP-forming)/AMP-acid ligase II